MTSILQIEQDSDFLILSEQFVTQDAKEIIAKKY